MISVIGLSYIALLIESSCCILIEEVSAITSQNLSDKQADILKYLSYLRTLENIFDIILLGNNLYILIYITCNTYILLSKLIWLIKLDERD